MEQKGPGAALNPGEEYTLITPNENDGKITLTFLNNYLEVRGDFFPPRSGGSPINADYIRGLFEKFNIIHGVDQDELHAAYKKCVKDGEVVRNVLIASGDPPKNEVLEYMQLNPLLLQYNTQEKEADAVDHRARSPFIIVKKDQALAKQKSHKPGREGKNVHGESIGYTVVRPEGVTPGENTRMEDRFLLSTINGQLVIEKKVVSVSDSLVIKGSVNYNTGNIIFPGNVEIHGTVSDGFKIYSGGSVTIKQTFDVTDAITKENLSVAGGIIGRGQAMVKVGGVLKTKFIENCRVACRKNVIVDLEIINSNVFTLDTLEMGEKGRIVGGEIYAVKGIRCGGIGRKTGKAARIHCGVDFTVEQEKEKYNGSLKILADKLGRLKELMSDPQAGEEKMKKMEVLLRRLEDEQRKAQAKVTELLGKMNNDWNATIEVKGDIVPGTLLEICQTALFVTEPLQNVRIRLDRAASKLVTEKL